MIKFNCKIAVSDVALYQLRKRNVKILNETIKGGLDQLKMSEMISAVVISLPLNGKWL